MDKVYVKGQKLFITTEDGTFDGTFHSMDEGKTRLTVKDVVKHPNEESFDGLYHFYKNEIISVQILDPLSSAWMSPGSEVVSSKVSTIMKGCQSSQSSTKLTKSYLQDFVLSQDHYIYYSNLLKKFVIIDEIGSEFDLAIEEIKRNPMVGVSFEGTMFGRKGKLSWVCFSVPYREEGKEEPEFIYLEPNHKNRVPQRITVYLFDLAVMGSAAITNGLGDILGGKDSPLKIMFDCRLPSDCLYHQFDLKLHNIADLQVCQILLYPLKERPPEADGTDKLMYTKGLHLILNLGLNLPLNLIYTPHIDDGYLERENAIWYQRPITSLMAKAAAYQTMYLMNMWAKIYLRDCRDAYVSGLKIFLSCIRDAEDETAFTLANQYHMVPQEFVPHVLKCQEKHRESAQCQERNQLQKGSKTKKIERVRGTSFRKS
ncbi:hypothetical protein J437_LFUL003635 [Ladona fulva]|uniref:Uncharacterized protein n=1 Tax=Ladona fulva TaxID=123851 RepID=A0A8K0NXS8_LADFU|nr:hypothetical protein J437_LFUL003635 [Ladona fulva]